MKKKEKKKETKKKTTNKRVSPTKVWKAKFYILANAYKLLVKAYASRIFVMVDDDLERRLGEYFIKEANK